MVEAILRCSILEVGRFRERLKVRDQVAPLNPPADSTGAASRRQLHPVLKLLDATGL